MPWYKIPCSWEMYGKLEIEAHSKEEAIKKCKDEKYLDAVELPDAEYLQGSFSVELEDELIEEFN